MKNRDQKILVIIAGVAGEIGISFAKKITNQEVNVLGVIRNKKVNDLNEYFNFVTCDLSNEYEIEDVFKNVELEKYDRIIYLHTIGVDKFNPRNYPDVVKMKTIDPGVYDINVNSFKYLLRYLGKRIDVLNNNGNLIYLKTAIIAGASDKYTPFVIEDFAESKFILREYIRSYVKRFPLWFSGLSINVTSTITESAIKVRPNAELDYWLTPTDVVEKSYLELLSKEMDYKEVDIFKPSPDFIEGYYEDKDALYKKWSKETGIKSKNLKI